MTAQIQTRFSDKKKEIHGNCLVTTYASYMDLPVEDCPQFQLLFDVKQLPGFWDEVVKLWLQQMGYKRLFYLTDPFITNGFDDYYFAYGTSPRGFSHQVIYKEGKLFHDPHPSQGGVEVHGYEVLEKIEGHWRHQKHDN